MSVYKDNKKYIDKLIAIAAISLSSYFFIKYILILILPFLSAYVLAKILSPFTHMLKSRLKLSKNIASILSLAVLISVAVFIGGLLLKNLMSEIRELSKDLPRHMESLIASGESLKTKYDVISSFIPAGLLIYLDSLYKATLDISSEIVKNNIGKHSFNFVVFLPSFFVSFIISIISCFFFIKDEHSLTIALYKLLPNNLIEKIFIVRHGIFSTIKNYIYTQLQIMIVTISISTTALFLLNFKYAFFIGFTIGLVDALPALGSGFILWPWALYSILTSDYNFGIGLLITYIVIFITRQILEAKIFAQKSGIHPLLIIISMYIGLKVYGFFGFFIGPVVIILIKVMVFDDDYHL